MSNRVKKINLNHSFIFFFVVNIFCILFFKYSNSSISSILCLFLILIICVSHVSLDHIKGQKLLKFFNIKFHQVKYENIVLNFDDEIKKILNYLNLDFETNMKNFFETAKSRENINTPSYDQVTKHLYSNSINRHLNFHEIKKIATNDKIC